MTKYISISSLLFLLLIIIFVSNFIYLKNHRNYTFNYESINQKDLDEKTLNLNLQSGFLWPTPGYNRITSYFGKRNAPTKRCLLFSLWNRYCSSNRN